MTTTPQEPDPEVVPSGDPEPMSVPNPETEPRPGEDPGATDASLEE